jgi:hypothetical protein
VERVIFACLGAEVFAAFQNALGGQASGSDH